MGQNILSDREMQAQRLKIKQLGQQMQNLAAAGTREKILSGSDYFRLISRLFSRNPAKKCDI